jgi:tRNA modification GTPase
LAAAPAALVSSQPGTTRDYLTTTLELDGVRCQLVDTAGAEPDHCGTSIASAAQQQTALQSRHADLRLLCLDVTRPLNAWEREQMVGATVGQRQIIVATKCDLQPTGELPHGAIATSSVNRLGLDGVRTAIRQDMVESTGSDTAAGLTAERCGQSLRLAGEALERAKQINRRRGGEELLAAEIRGALAELGKVVGAVYTDDILDRVFSRFCIGK